MDAKDMGRWVRKFVRLATHLMTDSHQADSTGFNAKPWPVVVFLHRNVRPLPAIFSDGVLRKLTFTRI